MTVSVVDLVTELKALRKGRGIQAPHIGDRIGPAIRLICGIGENDTAAAIRQRVATRLVELSARLPRDLRICVIAAFGLDDDLNTRFYKDRLRWAEAELERNSRTIRRRIDDALTQLAELAVYRLTGDPRETPDSPWHTVELRQALVLDQPTPDALELGRVVADEDGLTELDLAMTVTEAEAGTLDQTGIDVLYGGRLRRHRLAATDRIGYRLVLPRPLAVGEEHEYAVRHRTGPADGRGMLEPHFVCLPRHRCDRCEVRVRFAENVLPARVERLAGVLQRDIADPSYAADPLTPDASGEVMVRFADLATGLAYGLRWTPGR